ncbi:MAG: methylmalonyl-CoA mutase family protein, partial [Myxococcales bacterium]|nr:methylmalonyl-CoA mutase family protein [Myxococcales bacterium]
MRTPSDAPVRFVTAASLFDGHDASINIMRRILQSRGAEVIHLGHDRSVHEIVDAAIEEDAHGIAVSSYQGGHMEFFAYMVAQLRERGRGDIRVFGGGGGTITDKEIATLHDAGVARIYSVEDGRRLGLVGMIDHMIEHARRDLVDGLSAPPPGLWDRAPAAVARTLTWIEAAHAAGDEKALAAFRAEAGARPKRPVLGITGVGGAGKSSLTDELVRRLVEVFPDRTVAVLSVDPTRRRSGGALLGDRIRMNSASHPRVFMRSLATRSQNTAVPAAVRDALLALSAAGHDLVILETAGIGQSGSEVVDLADVSLYVMTPEFGAPSQLEKIDMLDFADVVALNKADKRGAADAKRYVQKQMQRNRGAFDRPVESMPVFTCVASRYGDAGVDALFGHLMGLVGARSGGGWDPGPLPDRAPKLGVVVPPERERYLSEVAAAVRGHHARAEAQAQVAAKADGLRRALAALGDRVPAVAQRYGEMASDAALAATVDEAAARLRALYDAALGELTPDNRALLASVPALRAAYSAPSHTYVVRGREIAVENFIETLSGNRVPKVALP